MTDTPSQPDTLNALISDRRAGGEVRQHATDGAERLTTAQGVVIADNQNSLRAGAPGPTLLEDFAMREKIFHFDHERILERIVHARGYGAHGFVRLFCQDETKNRAPFRQPFQPHSCSTG